MRYGRFNDHPERVFIVAVGNVWDIVPGREWFFDGSSAATMFCYPAYSEFSDNQKSNAS